MVAMASHPVRGQCATRAAIELVTDTWSTLVLYALRAGPVRFNQLRREINGGISQKMLTQTLRRLEHRGLIRRTVFPTVPPGVEYALTPLGQSFLEPMMNLVSWAEQHTAQLGLDVAPSLR